MLKTFSVTNIGRKRKMNQDYVYSSEEPVGHLPNLFLVADGMGGHNAGGIRVQGHGGDDRGMRGGFRPDGCAALL